MLDSTKEYEQITRDLDEAFGESFMQPEILQTTCAEAVNDYGVDPELVDHMNIDKTIYLARLSASGYLDCTDWHIAEKLREAADILIEYYAD